MARGRAQREAAVVGLAAAGSPGGAPTRAACQALVAGRAAPSALPVDLPRLEPRFCVDVGAPVADLAVGERCGQPCLFAAAGSTVQALDAAGRAVAVMRTAAAVQVLHWWPKCGLLLVGCEDDQVLAFDAHGRQRWAFASQEDPAVFQAAKQYWFRSAPGHGGIHGLDSGPFHQGRLQAFVGSACTLEVLEADGSLCRRLPVFWGPGSRFALVPGPAGGTDLLVARQPADGAGLSVVDSETLQVRASNAYNSVPAGHTADCGGFASTTRQHLLLADVDGDGAPELVSEVNGTLSRVTVWELGSGRALASAQFGTVSLEGGRTMGREGRRALGVRDLDAVDLDGDGRIEILVALATGRVVALDGACRPLWSRRLDSPPLVLGGLSGRGVVVGTEDGAVLRLDASGRPAAQGCVRGAPMHLALLGGEWAVVGTDQGRVALL